VHHVGHLSRTCYLSTAHKEVQQSAYKAHRSKFATKAQISLFESRSRISVLQAGSLQLKFPSTGNYTYRLFQH